MITPGRRVQPDADGLRYWLMRPCEYGRDPASGVWYGRTPNGHLVNLAAHQVTEHNDGTVTVTPSIGVKSSRYSEEYDTMVTFTVWHGFLEHGHWRQA
jgi:hypothetical protein